MRQQCSEKPVFLHNGTRGLRINLDDVVYAVADHNHCTVVMADGLCHDLSCQLGQLEPMLCAYDSFVRIHRQLIVNIWHIEMYIGTLLTMDNGEMLTIGKTFLNCLNSHITLISEQGRKK